VGVPIYKVLGLWVLSYPVSDRWQQQWFISEVTPILRLRVGLQQYDY